jgi:hypothetical protein
MMMSAALDTREIEPVIVEGSIDETDVVRDALRNYFGDGAIVGRWEAVLRQDYMGDASRKRRVGGALLVSCGVAIDGEIKSETLEIDDLHRPLNEAAIKIAGAAADLRFEAGDYVIRDIFG